MKNLMWIRPNGKTWITLFLIVLLVILLRLPSLIEPLDNDSGAIAYHARLILRGEPLYGTHHPLHHMPGAYYTYWLSFLLFGDQAVAPKLLLIPWFIAISLLLFWMGDKYFNRKVAVLAAVFYPLVASHVLLKGMTGVIELFANLPLTAGVFLGLSAVEHKSDWRYFWVGFFGALSMLYKVNCIAPLGVGVFVILARAWVEWGQANTIRKTVIRILVLASGFLVPIFLVYAYFATLGLTDRLLLVFKLGIWYTQNFTFLISDVRLHPFIFPILYVTINNVVLLILGIGGTIRLFRQSRTDRSAARVIKIGIVVWLLISFLQAGITSFGLLHYVLLIVPPLVLISGIEIDALQRVWQKNEKTQKLAHFGGASLICLVILNSVIVNHAIYWHYIRYQVGIESYDTFLSQREQGIGKDYLHISRVARYIREHTLPEDRVYYFGFRAQFYYFADREAPIDNIWLYYISVTGQPERIFGPATKCIIVSDTIDRSQFAWLEPGLARDFQLETVIEGDSVYCRPNP